MLNDAARQYTDRQLEELEREMHRAYKQAYDELGEKWARSFEQAREAEKPYLEAYEAAKRANDPDAIRKTGRALARERKKNTLLSNAYQRNRDILAQDLAQLDKAAYALANGKLNAIYAVNYNALAAHLPAGYAYGLVNPRTVHNLLTKQVNLVKATTWNKQLMNQQVLQGILQGESMDKIAKRFSKVLNMNETSAMRNARTAVTYAENQGRLDSMKAAEEKGTVLVKVWSATHDNRTRDSHKEVDGHERPLDERFENGCLEPGDPSAEPEEIYNCRCALGTRIIGFKRADGSIVYVDK